MSIHVTSDNIALWDFLSNKGNFVWKYIGHTEQLFDLEKSKIKSKDIRQFKYICEGEFTIFNNKQIKKLDKEIEILRKEGNINRELLELVKSGIDEALKKDNLYLKFQDD